MASIGGNLCQRARCSYFRDATSPCNKRILAAAAPPNGPGPGVTGGIRDQAGLKTPSATTTGL
jgi:xanthine dehydrogenase YagS FAD-binding subunit